MRRRTIILLVALLLAGVGSYWAHRRVGQPFAIFGNKDLTLRRHHSYRYLGSEWVAEHVEELWKQGKQTEYVDLTSALSLERIEACRQAPERTPQLLAELGRFLDKDRFADPRIAPGSVEKQAEMLRNVASLFASRQPSPHLPYIEPAISLSSNFLHQVHTTLAQVPLRPAYINVPLPAGGPGFSGMDPGAISNPKQRQAYLTAIAENGHNVNMNNYHFALIHAKSVAERCIVSLRQTEAGKPKTEREAQAWSLARSIRPGLTRGDVGKVATQDGGLYHVYTAERYNLKGWERADGRVLKIRVQLAPRGASREACADPRALSEWVDGQRGKVFREDASDIVVSVSEPYVERPFRD